MMLSITTSSGQKLDLFPDTTISIEENSPMFTDIGSYSLPIELPPTPGNLQILGFPDRFQRRSKFVKSTRVTLACGPYSRVCRMHIDTVIHRSTISATLFLRESSFYNLAKEKTLQQLFDDKVRNDYQPAPNTTDNQWVPYLNRVMCGDHDDDFHIFPVLLSIEDRQEGDSTSQKTWKKFLIANRPSYLRHAGNNYTGNSSVSLSGVKYYNLHALDYEYDKDDKPINMAPPGYTVAPYLKAVYVLRYAFSKLGYTLTNSILDTDYSFKRLCILHPTVDAIVTHTIKYSQLLPDVEFVDFLNMFENSFGLRFVVDESQKTVTPRFFRDVLKDNPVIDLSSQIEDYPQIEYAGNKDIKLTALHLSEQSQPIDGDSWQQLLKKYGPYQGTVENIWYLTWYLIPEGLASPGFYLLTNERMLARVFKKTPNQSSYDCEYIGSYVHDYSPLVTETTLDEKELGFAITPLYPVPLVGYTLKSTTSTSGTIWDSWADAWGKFFGLPYPLANGDFAYIPFIDSVQNLNTVMQTTSVDSSNNKTVTYADESEVKAPIYLAFAHGFAKQNPPNNNEPVTMFSSQDAYDHLGNVKGTFSLMPVSLYENFWKEYALLLQTSFHDVSARINLSIPQLMSLQFDKPIAINGVLALPLSVRYTLTNSGIKSTNFSLRIITPYEQ